MKLPIVSLALAVGFCNFVYAADKGQWEKEPDSFMGISFASNIVKDLPLCPEGVYSFNQKTLCYEKPYFDNGRYTILGTPDIGLSYTYSLTAKVRDERVEHFYVSIKNSDYEKLVSVFKAKYGEPVRVTSDPVVTGAGAKLDNTIMSWEGKKVHMMITQYDGDIDSSSVFLVDMEQQAKSAAELESKASDAASKL